jgi:hypothetical protein
MAVLLPGEETLMPIEYAPRRDLEPGGAVWITGGGELLLFFPGMELRFLVCPVCSLHVSKLLHMSCRILIFLYKTRKNATFYLMLMVQNLGPRNVSFPFGCIDFNTFLPASSTGLYREEVEFSVLSHSLLPFKDQLLVYAPPGSTSKNSAWWLHCIYVFCMDLRTNSDFSLLQHFLPETQPLSAAGCNIQILLKCEHV